MDSERTYYMEQFANAGRCSRWFYYV